MGGGTQMGPASKTWDPVTTQIGLVWENGEPTRMGPGEQNGPWETYLGKMEPGDDLPSWYTSRFARVILIFSVSVCIVLSKFIGWRGGEKTTGGADSADSTRTRFEIRNWGDWHREGGSRFCHSSSGYFLICRLVGRGMEDQRSFFGSGQN